MDMESSSDPKLAFNKKEQRTFFASIRRWKKSKGVTEEKALCCC